MAEVSLLLKATAVLTAALAVTRAAQRTSASVRALVLASAFGVLLALPLAAVLVPSRAVVIPVDSVASSFFLEDAAPLEGRRRDWLVHLVARVACAVYWFQPLAWLAWRRFRLECERACDDAVVRGADGTAYAEQLIVLARRLTNRTLQPLVSMATQSHLAARVLAVLDSGQPRGRAGTACAAAVAGAALAVMLVSSPLQAMSPIAPAPVQDPPKATQPQASASTPAFEVTSVRRNTSGAIGGRQQFTDGRFAATNTTVQLLLQDAYRMQVFQIAGGPEWIGSARFDIAATIPANTPGEQRPLMLRALLAERFNLRAHMETRELPIFALLAARSDGRLGPDLKVSSLDCTAVATGGALRAPVTAVQPDGRPACGMTMGPAAIRGGGATMMHLANALAQFVRRPVVDRTGLAGFYDFDLRYAPPARGTPPPDAPDDRPSIFTAVQEQLGLRLDAARGPVEVLVIDRLEMPTEN